MDLADQNEPMQKLIQDESLNQTFKETQRRFGLVTKEGELKRIFPDSYDRLFGKLGTYKAVKRAAQAFGYNVCLIELEAELKPTGRYQIFNDEGRTIFKTEG